MVILSVRPGSGRLAPEGKRWEARFMYQKGGSFLLAALHLHGQRGHEYVSLHLLCQGIENTVKGALLLKDYDKYKPRLREIRHNLEKLVATATSEFGLHPLKPQLAKELQHLSGLYSAHWLRYGHLHDIFVDAATIPCDRVWRRMAAVLRLVERRGVFKPGTSPQPM